MFVVTVRLNKYGGWHLHPILASHGAYVQLSWRARRRPHTPHTHTHQMPRFNLGSADAGEGANKWSRLRRRRRENSTFVPRRKAQFIFILMYGQMHWMLGWIFLHVFYFAVDILVADCNTFHVQQWWRRDDQLLIPNQMTFGNTCLWCDIDFYWSYFSFFFQRY